MTDSIVRVQHDKASPYVVVSKALAESTALSFAARGMMLYLLAKPDDWRVRMGDLERASGGLGEQATRTVFAELEAAGYVVRTRERSAKTGQWVYETTVYESPVSAPAAHGQAVDGATVDGSAVCGSTAHGEVPHVLSMDQPSTHPGEDANASSRAPVPERPKREPSPLQAQHNAAQTAVREHFERRTGLSAPEKGRAKGVATLWWNPIREVCALSDWDVGRATRLVDAALERLRGMTVSDPNSILKTARALAAEKRRDAPAGRVMPGGAVMMPSVGRREP